MVGILKLLWNNKAWVLLAIALIAMLLIWLIGMARIEHYQSENAKIAIELRAVRSDNLVLTANLEKCNNNAKSLQAYTKRILDIKAWSDTTKCRLENASGFTGDDGKVSADESKVRVYNDIVDSFNGMPETASAPGAAGN